jgi:hypothetical protein
LPSHAFNNNITAEIAEIAENSTTFLSRNKSQDNVVLLLKKIRKIVPGPNTLPEAP